MEALNPNWLSIELDSIDESTERWNDALRSSYQASVRVLARAEEGGTTDRVDVTLAEANFAA
jgi:hypothetical protein